MGAVGCRSWVRLAVPCRLSSSIRKPPEQEAHLAGQTLRPILHVEASRQFPLDGPFKQARAKASDGRLSNSGAAHFQPSNVKYRSAVVNLGPPLYQNAPSWHR